MIILHQFLFCRLRGFIEEEDDDGDGDDVAFCFQFGCKKNAEGSD